MLYKIRWQGREYIGTKIRSYAAGAIIELLAETKDGTYIVKAFPAVAIEEIDIEKLQNTEISDSKTQTIS